MLEKEPNYRISSSDVVNRLTNTIPKERQENIYVKFLTITMH